MLKKILLDRKIFLLISLFLLWGCDNTPVDYRDQYMGNFNFKVITEFWMVSQPTSYDTSYYDGVIRKYELSDSDNDMYNDDDSAENPDEKITIQFTDSLKITSLLSTNGLLVTKSGFHYYHHGGFSDMDTIAFAIEGLGSLGGGWNYEVIGVRQ